MSKNVYVNGDEEEFPRPLVAVTLARNLDSDNSEAKLVLSSK